MRFNPDIHNRQSTRIRAYDYSRYGAYFFTIATANRESMFGEVCNGNMSLNISGDKVASEWHALPSRFSDVILDEFIVMPNHIHGILIIDCADGNDENQGAASGAPTLGAIIRCLKSRSAIAVNKIHNRSGRFGREIIGIGLFAMTPNYKRFVCTSRIIRNNGMQTYYPRRGAACCAHVTKSKHQPVGAPLAAPRVLRLIVL